MWCLPTNVDFVLTVYAHLIFKDRYGLTSNPSASPLRCTTVLRDPASHHLSLENTLKHRAPQQAGSSHRPEQQQQHAARRLSSPGKGPGLLQSGLMRTVMDKGVMTAPAAAAAVRPTATLTATTPRSTTWQGGWLDAVAVAFACLRNASHGHCRAPPGHNTAAGLTESLHLLSRACRALNKDTLQQLSAKVRGKRRTGTLKNYGTRVQIFQVRLQRGGGGGLTCSC